MKGLIIKDIFALRQQGKIFLALLMFYAVYSVVYENLSMLAAMIVLLCVILPITTMAYDEKSKWDKYALSMPIQRKTIVCSKYLLAIIAEFLAVITVSIIGGIIVFFTGEIAIGEMIIMTLALGGVGLFSLALILPLLFKFGVEKSRLIMLLIPSVIIIMLPQLGIEPPSAQTLRFLGYLSPLLIAGILLLSVKISVGIYNKKEF
ncbi:ABC-2 transporter permease [Desulfitobacterium chlororespirans]|uniref:ABC-2 family transporter protein n=1 Tax=Desulfitobacterium chlororespirans DSM 11544 TaxID=1121395 RepID=A0A1M7TXV3_9FIRM|nr:ABC-2 transporter permease [Desulfitobacterium chlororespirans]SHN75554.1 ABC-2 family transporter protein [Desulfitobacterium chlororespirans DSM 11544]